MKIKSGALIVKLENGKCYQVKLTQGQMTDIIDGIDNIKVINNPLELDIEKYEDSINKK